MPPDADPPDVIPFDFATYCDACDAAREQNEYVPPDRVRRPAAAASDARGDRPGDDFNRRGAWADILGPHGWTVHHTDGEATYWTRPGKDVRAGQSASTGHCSSDDSGDLLYVFTSSAAPFEPDAAYSKFAAYALLEHGGDFSVAARRLRQDGYGGEADDPEVVFDDLPPPDPPPEGADPTDIDVATVDDLRAAGAAINWVWEGWVQRDVVSLLAAEGGTGKTRFAADLTRRVRHGLNWPDGKACPKHPGCVALWVVSDNHHGEMVTLADGFGLVDCVRFNATRADPYGGVSLETVEEFVELEKRIALVRPLFVFVDTVGNATDRNLSRQEDAKQFYQPLQIIARRQKVAVIALTHLNASGKTLGRRANEKCRTVLRMSAGPKQDGEPEPKRRLEIVKSNSLRPSPLGVVMGAAGNEYDDQPPPPPEADGVPQVVLSENPKPPTRTERRASAKQWLLDLLTANATLASEVVEFGEEEGYGRDLLDELRVEIGAESVRINKRYWWRMPPAE